MNLIEWLRYRLHGVAWRVPVWILVVIIALLITINAVVLIWQPWPRPVFSADISYVMHEFNVTDTNFEVWILIEGEVRNIGNANGTCSLEINVKEIHGYLGEYSEIIDMGVLAPGDVFNVNLKRYLYSGDNPLKDMFEFEVTYRLLY